MSDRQPNQPEAVTRPEFQEGRIWPAPQSKLDLAHLPFIASSNQNVTYDAGTSSFTPQSDSYLLIQEARDNLNPQQIEATIQYLQSKSSLLARITMEVSQHLINVYRTHLRSQETAESRFSISLTKQRSI